MLNKEVETQLENMDLDGKHLCGANIGGPHVPSIIIEEREWNRGWGSPIMTVPMGISMFPATGGWQHGSALMGK